MLDENLRVVEKVVDYDHADAFETHARHRDGASGVQLQFSIEIDWCAHGWSASAASLSVLFGGGLHAGVRPVHRNADGGDDSIGFLQHVVCVIPIGGDRAVPDL